MREDKGREERIQFEFAPQTIAATFRSCTGVYVVDRHCIQQGQ